MELDGNVRGFMMSAIIPLLIGFIYDITRSHLYTKAIYIILIAALLLTVFAINKRNNKA